MNLEPAVTPSINPAFRSPWINRLRRIHWLLVAVFQGILVLFMVHHSWFIWDHRVIGLQGDSSIYLWFLAWWGHAIHQGLSLGVTHLVTYPWGNNVLWDTAVPLVFIPFSLLVHGHFLTLSLAYNLCTFVGWWFSGFAAYLSFWGITHRRWASMLGSTLTLTSAYYTNQALGHTDLMWVGFAYLLFLTLYRYTVDGKSRVWLVIRFVPLALCSWLTNQEYFVTTQMMILFGIAVLVHYAIHQVRPWSEVRRVFLGYAASAAATLVVTLPLLVWQLSTPDQPFHPFSAINRYQINLANLIVPVHTWLQIGSASLTGNVMEQDGYFGVVCLVGLVCFSLLTRSHGPSLKRALIYWTAWLLVLAMGDSLLISQHTSTHMPLPGIALSLIPIFKDIIFDRFMWGVFWGVGLLTTIIYGQLTPAFSKVALTLWAGLVVVTWWPQGYPVQTLSPNRWITAAVQKHILKPHEVILVFPMDTVYSPNNNVLITQIANHFRYRLAEGYLTPNDALLEHDNGLISYWTSINLYGPHSTLTHYFHTKLKHPVHIFMQFLTKVQPGAVVLTPMAHETYMHRWLTNALGPPTGQSGHTVFWLSPTNHSQSTR